MTADRIVSLRSERVGADSRSLTARLSATGDLVIEGQDLGPSVERIFASSTYEWIETIRREHVADLMTAIGASPGDDVLDALVERFSGDASHGLPAVLAAAGIPFERHVHF